MPANPSISKFNDPGIRDFILTNEKIDLSAFILSGPRFPGVSNAEIANQIACRKKAKKKLPEWYTCKAIVYPAKISLEQASSEETAKWKAENFSGDSCLDLTGGVGVDSYYFSKSFSRVTYVEKNSELAKIAEYNHKQLSAYNIRHLCDRAEEFIKNNSSKFDLVYLDPSRRVEGRRVISVEKYEPEIKSILPLLKSITGKILIKISPLQDIADVLRKLNNIFQVHILVIANEVKELLLKWDENMTSSEISIHHLNSREPAFTFDFKREGQAPVSLSEPKKYLYEPNAGIMKSGGFNSLSQQFKISKLHNNTHLYTSDQLIEFPGRRFLISEIISPEKKILQKKLPAMKANLTLRNFPGSVAGLRKKLGLSDGSDDYLFALTDINNRKKLILCRKV